MFRSYGWGYFRRFVLLILMTSSLYSVQLGRPEDLFIVKVLNPELLDISPGQVRTIKFEIDAFHTATIDKMVYMTETGMELLSPYPTYGKKSFKAGEVMFMEVKVRSTIRGQQGFGIWIYCRDEHGKPQRSIGGGAGASVGGHTFFHPGVTVQPKSASDMRKMREYLKKYNRKPTWTDEELRLAEAEEKILRGPLTQIDLAYKPGSTPTMTSAEIQHTRTDPSSEKAPKWYKEWIKRH